MTVVKDNALAVCGACGNIDAVEAFSYCPTCKIHICAPCDCACPVDVSAPSGPRLRLRILWGDCVVIPVGIAREWICVRALRWLVLPALKWYARRVIEADAPL